MLQDLVKFQKEQMTKQELESREIHAEKAAKDAQLEESNRKLKELKEQLDKTNELNEIDLKNIKNHGETEVMQRIDSQQTMEQDIETTDEQIREVKEKINRNQNQRLKEVKSLQS